MDNQNLAAIGHATLSKVFKDGTLRIIVDIDPQNKHLLGNMMDADVPVAVVRLTNESAAQQTANQLIKQSAKYGEQAKQLRLSAFFRTPDVWRAIGSDADYQAWCRKQVCAHCKHTGSDNNPIEYAHVRRIADGAGVGIKPDYSGIPLCHVDHERQHRIGESALGGKEVVDKLKIDHLQKWAWETLKANIGYQHWSECPPNVLKEWADKHELTRYLPDIYRNAA